MAQNIPSLLQTAQQQHSQGTATPIVAPIDSTEDNTSMGLAKAMVGKGAMAQKLARERTAENKDRFQTMFADSGVGFQGLLNTLAIGLGDKIAKPSGDGAVDAEMEAAIAGDTALTTIQEGILTAKTPEDFAFLKQVAATNPATFNMVATIDALLDGAVNTQNKQKAKDFLLQNPSGVKVEPVTDEKGLVITNRITYVDENDALQSTLIRGSVDQLQAQINTLAGNMGSPESGEPTTGEKSSTLKFNAI